MRTASVQGWLLGAVVASAAVTLAGTAGAQGQGKEPKGKNTPSPASVSGSVSIGGGDDSDASVQRSTKRREGEEEGKKEEGGEAEEEKIFKIGLDFVVGVGKQNIVNQTAPSVLSTDRNTTIDRTKMTTYSMVLGASVEVAKGWGLAFRLPFSAGHIATPESRGTGALGNIELEGFYERELNEKLRLEIALGVALPTAQGEEIPEAADAVPASGVGIDQAGYDRSAVQKMVAASRGYEDNALFEPKHLGIIPKVTLVYHTEKFHVDPWLKVENLIATASGFAHSYIGELVVGANAGYYVAPQFEPALRVWANVPITGADFKTVLVAEPQLRFHVGDVTPVVGVILPVAGSSLTDPYALGVRFGLAGAF